MTDPTVIQEIPVDELARECARGAVVVDVRMPDEYADGHVPGALLLPLPELADRHGELPATDVLYVVCRSGARSLTACQYLSANGRPAINVAGGTLAWVEAGHPAATGPEPG